VSAVWWQTLLLLLAVTAVLSVAWYSRAWVVAKASAARFFAASLLVHCMLLLWLCAVPLAQAVVEQAEVIRVSKAAELFDEPQARRDSRPAYEKVADLRAEQAAAPKLVRKVPAPTNMPDATSPLEPTIPAHAVRSLPPERLLFVPTRQPETVRRPQEIERRSIVKALKPVEVNLDMPELPPPEAVPRERPIENRPVEQARRQAVAPTPADPQSLRLPEMKRPRPADLRPEAADRPTVREGKKLPNPLTGRRRPGRTVAVVPHEPEAPLKAEASPQSRPPADVRVMVPRLAVPRSPLPAEPSDEPARPRPSLKQPARVGAPSLPPVEVAPRFDPQAVRLPRRAAGIGRLAKVQDKVAPQATLLLRQKEIRQRSVELYGGTKASEAAVERGLAWLAAHQNATGSWSLHNFHANCKHPRCTNAGTVTSDPAGTGMVLLPFLGAGNTHQSGKHKQTVGRAFQWLVGQQRPDGSWPAPGDARPMYGHGMASIALCEAYGMTQDAKLRGPAQKALDYIVKAQHAPTGGWRYTPNQPADTSVVGWQLMALKSGEMAGLTVPAKTFDGVKRWLASVEANRPVGGLFGYQSANPTPAMTAQGLLCLQYLGERRTGQRMQAGTEFLLKHLPRVGAETSYYWYHANQVMYHMQGKHWKSWNDKLRDLLVSTQATQGGLAGSWKPTDQREMPGGRLYGTALRLLMLEVYYRHLPLYQQLEK
jgi:hypothetical protein